MRQAFQCVQTAESHRSLVVAELLNRAGVQLGDALLYGVSRSGGRNFALVLQGRALVLQDQMLLDQSQLGGPLSAGSQQQGKNPFPAEDRVRKRAFG